MTNDKEEAQHSAISSIVFEEHKKQKQIQLFCGQGITTKGGEGVGWRES